MINTTTGLSEPFFKEVYHKISKRRKNGGKTGGEKQKEGAKRTQTRRAGKRKGKRGRREEGGRGILDS